MKQTKRSVKTVKAFSFSLDFLIVLLLLFPLTVVTSLTSGCSEDADDASKMRNAADTLKLKHSTSDELADSLTRIIRNDLREQRLQLYTKESRESIAYNNKLGIGTAGTLDGIILEEISACKANPKQNNAPVKILKRRGQSLLLQWPSGKKGTAIIKSRDNKVYLDIISSPGGDILLLRE